MSTSETPVINSSAECGRVHRIIMWMILDQQVMDKAIATIVYLEPIIWIGASSRSALLVNDAGMVSQFVVHNITLIAAISHWMTDRAVSIIDNCW